MRGMVPRGSESHTLGIPIDRGGPEASPTDGGFARAGRLPRAQNHTGREVAAEALKGHTRQKAREAEGQQGQKGDGRLVWPHDGYPVPPTFIFQP